MRTPLTPFYRAMLGLACAAATLVLMAQLAMILDRLLGLGFLGGEAYAGYFLAASAFLALPDAFQRGDHIRVTLFLERFPARARFALELLCLACGCVVIGYFAWHAGSMAWMSFVFNDASMNFDATPLWIPQSFMALGVLVLFVAMVEELCLIIVRRRILAKGSGDEPMNYE